VTLLGRRAGRSKRAAILRNLPCQDQPAWARAIDCEAASNVSTSRVHLVGVSRTL